MRLLDPLQRAGVGTGRPSQAASRKLSAIDRLLGNGPILADGPHKVRVSSDGMPATATLPANGATYWPASYTAVAWSVTTDSDEVVWTSTSSATVGVAGWYDLYAVLGGTPTPTPNSLYGKWQKNGADLGPAHSHSNAAGYAVQTDAWEPRVRLNVGDTVQLVAKADNATVVTVGESRLAIRLLREITEMNLVKGTGSTITYSGDADEVWLTRDAASSSIADTLTDVAIVTGLPVGLYHFEYHGIYQTTATTTGVGFAAAFTGTATGYAEQRHATTGTTASTAAATGAGAGATGNLYEAQGQRTLGTLIGAVTVSVDAANTDTRVTVEGDLNVTVSGNFSIKQRAESAGLACTARIGSVLILRRLS